MRLKNTGGGTAPTVRPTPVFFGFGLAYCNEQTNYLGKQSHTFYESSGEDHSAADVVAGLRLASHALYSRSCEAANAHTCTNYSDTGTNASTKLSDSI